MKYEYEYEFISHQSKLPIKIQIVNICQFFYHWHKDVEIVFVLKGSVNLLLEKNQFFLKESDIVLINSQTVHSFQNTKGLNQILILQIDPDFIKYYYPNIGNIRFECNSVLADDDSQKKFDHIRSFMAQISWEFYKKRDGYQFYITGVLNQLVGNLFRNFKYHIFNLESMDVHLSDLDRLKSVVKYVDEHFMDKITLQEMAEKEHLSIFYFSHFFTEKMGIPFYEYVNHVRIDKAVKLLTEGDDTIITIALDCGFANVTSFNRYLKRKYNCTPSKYREINRTNSNTKTFSNFSHHEEGFDKSYMSINTFDSFDLLLPYFTYEK